MAGEQDKTEDLREPSLWREIGSVAWMFAKVAGVILAVVGALIPLFRWSPVAGIGVLYGLVFTGLIVQLGHWNYKWKKSELEWKRKAQADRLKWEEADQRSRSSGDKTA